MAIVRFETPATLRLAKEDSFIRRVGRIGCMALALCTVFLVSGLAAAEDHGGSKEEGKAQAAPSPVKMNPDSLAGVGLSPGEPFIAPEDILEGNHRPRGDSLFRGKELIVRVYEDDPATFAITRPFPVDEFVLILNGKLILTDANGKVQEFVAGESLMVPKGFSGTWQMLGNYRELIVVDRQSYENATKAAE